jgi:hypothetical protein
MANLGSEVHRSVRTKVPECDVRIPPAVRWLAYMSTSRWQPHPPVHPAVAQVVTTMEAEGWMIRGAWTRNYLLWRNGRTMRERRLPLLVLPLAYGRLSALQINVFLAVEIIEARFRLRRTLHPDHARAEAGELQSVLKLVGAETGVAIADPFRLHREATLGLGRLIR